MIDDLFVVTQLSCRVEMCYFTWSVLKLTSWNCLYSRTTPCLDVKDRDTCIPCPCVNCPLDLFLSTLQCLTARLLGMLDSDANVQSLGSDTPDATQAHCLLKFVWLRKHCYHHSNIAEWAGWMLSLLRKLGNLQVLTGNAYPNLKEQLLPNTCQLHVSSDWKKKPTQVHIAASLITVRTAEVNWWICKVQ